MAIDAIDDGNDDEEPDAIEALEKVLDNPTQLMNLDLKAFAAELERQGLGQRLTTLVDIRMELESAVRYKVGLIDRSITFN